MLRGLGEVTDPRGSWKLAALPCPGTCGTSLSTTTSEPAGAGCGRFAAPFAGIGPAQEPDAPAFPSCAFEGPEFCALPCPFAATCPERGLTDSASPSCAAWRALFSFSATCPERGVLGPSATSLGRLSSLLMLWSPGALWISPLRPPKTGVSERQTCMHKKGVSG